MIEYIDCIEKDPNSVGELLWIMRRTSLTKKQVQQIAQLPNTRKTDDLLIYIGLKWPLYEDDRGNFKLLTAEEIEEENRRQTEETKRKLQEAGLEI